MERLICILAGYLCGLFQTGYIYGELHHVDIRQHGSGNAGTTNALRTLGWKAGIITFLGDILKCVLAVVIVRLFYGKTHADTIEVLEMYAGVGAVLGHNYPFYLNFKGGKGIAATAGLFVAINPKAALVAMVVFIIIVAVTRYVSLGSISLVIIFAVSMILKGQSLAGSAQIELCGLSIFLALLAIYKHRENIKRLIAGTENKLSFGKK